MSTMLLNHHQLPSPFDTIVSRILLEDVENADYYLLLICILLLILAFVQLRAFARPPPVPLKKLPRRPAIQILFKPDDIASSSSAKITQQTTVSKESDTSQSRGTRPSVFMRTISESFFRSGRSQSSGQLDTTDASLSEGGFKPDGAFQPSDDVVSDDEDGDLEPETEPPFLLHSQDLPDSFAPLLSSSQMEVLRHQMTADLVHAVHAKGGVRIREGRHEIPLDKDKSRPQLLLEVPKGGCKVAIAASVGSDGLSSDEDLDVSRPTSSRSKPMVKHAGLVLHPPLPLANVAPTLIHFPTLFEDKFVPTLRRIQIVRFALDLVISFSSLIEKVLWIIESKCKIHLSTVNVTPLYKGSSENNSPEWRLALAFSGHVLLFDWIPMPFINVRLPTFIIPHPHALLDRLLTAQPLASAKVRHENIAEKRLALAGIDILEGWNMNVKAVATPPALGVDVTMSGGVAVAVEMMHGMDAGAGTRREDRESFVAPAESESISGNSMSSWTTNPESTGKPRRRASLLSPSIISTLPPFDANELVPWFLEVSAKGKISEEKMTVHILKMSASHEDNESSVEGRSNFTMSGSLAIWKADLMTAQKSTMSSPFSLNRRRSNSFSHAIALAAASGEPASVCAILLSLDETSGTSKAQRLLRMLQYDYAFDVWDDSMVDTITLSVGASHPMLTGGTMVTTILEKIYAFGSISAREGSVLDPSEPARKRNILRHLPAVDFTCGVQNVFIPVESLSYSDDGLSRCTPEMDNGRMKVRVVGGLRDNERAGDGRSSPAPQASVPPAVLDGIKIIADFSVGSISLNTDAKVSEFPELDIFEGSRLVSLLSGALTGRISSHLRHQASSDSSLTTTGPNVFNPLEAYEVNFSGSSVFFKIKEWSSTLGHRRVIMPTESSVVIKVVESVVDMSMEGKTDCELSWDLNGLSPILQVTHVGESPAAASHENKRQTSLLIPPLRQGRLNFHVSAVGGIRLSKAETSREDREGLYDWKFFNAIVSPDEESPDRIFKVIHDKRTMEKLLSVVDLVNSELHKILSYVLTQVWRAKEIFDKEGVSDPGHAIPGHKMARLVSLFLCGDDSQVDAILPIIQGATSGEGLDVVKVKELLRQNLAVYDEWAPEIDRMVRWASVMFGAAVAPLPYVEKSVPPLCQVAEYSARFENIPSAHQLYDQIHDRPQLPLDPNFSNLVSRVAPYMSYRQTEYLLQARDPTDWQPSDLRRLRYVYSVKKRVQDISESYGGLSFLPQSFLVSVFLGEATRASLRWARRDRKKRMEKQWRTKKSRRMPILPGLRLRSAMPRQTSSLVDEYTEDFVITPAGRVASQQNLADNRVVISDGRDFEPTQLSSFNLMEDLGLDYELGDSLLGPQDVAILLQAGLTSAMKGSTVVQLNQRMLIDLMTSQPKSFAIAVLAEIGTPGGQGSPRSLTSALMALLDLDQSAFTRANRLDMHALLESWLPGYKVPRREDYLAGGRWARQSFYEAIYGLATSILEDAECYMALKSHIQRDRRHTEDDPIPQPKELSKRISDSDLHQMSRAVKMKPSKMEEAIALAKAKIREADEAGMLLRDNLVGDEEKTKSTPEYGAAIESYRTAFSSCALVLEFDKCSFQAEWFSEFYKRNYDALMVKSIFDNVIDNVDHVRDWLNALRRGDPNQEAIHSVDTDFVGETTEEDAEGNVPTEATELEMTDHENAVKQKGTIQDDLFSHPELVPEQVLVDAIIDCVFYYEADRERIRKDPLVRLLIPNPDGNYHFTIVTAMGVITEGKKGLELQDAFRRIKEKRDVEVVRADTGTARSLEYNSAKIEEAIETAGKMKRPYGLLGYSQGCANALNTESLLLSGSPVQQQSLVNREAGLVCRQLLFSAANGSMHGPAMDLKVQRLIILAEEFFKYQQGYCSRAFTSTVLELVNQAMDSSGFQKFFGGAQSMLPEGCKAFWRECQHLAHIPTCTMRGVLEEHTLPESLEMVSHLLTKQSGSPLHDSQVHVFDAVGHPVYTLNRNGRILSNCDVGKGAVQRTHHWSPLSDEVEFVRTQRDVERASFECAKDRHVFPWVDVNVRFGFVRYAFEDETNATVQPSGSDNSNRDADTEDINTDAVDTKT